ncbi:MAG: metal-dependent transcriptional regulator [Calditrichaceae bacterium]
MNLSASQENYIKIIWYLEQNNLKPASKVVADRLNVKPPTVLSMFNQLEKMELLTYNKNDGARLTEKGDMRARKLVRKHRLIETFLESVLEMEENVVHEEAELLEHVISDQLMYRIDAYLGFPRKDPHGTIIPSWQKNGVLVSLNNIEQEHSFVVRELDLDDEISDYFEKNGLRTGTLWTMAEVFPDKSSFLITNGKRFLALSSETAEKIGVNIQ